MFFYFMFFAEFSSFLPFFSVFVLVFSKLKFAFGDCAAAKSPQFMNFGAVVGQKIKGWENIPTQILSKCVFFMIFIEHLVKFRTALFDFRKIFMHIKSIVIGNFKKTSGNIRTVV